MLFAYESPGTNALGWLTEKTVKPEAIDFFGRMNHFMDIAWGDMFVQIIQMLTLGFCVMFVLEVFNMREVGKMCLWLAIVECFAIVAKAIAG